MGQSLAALIATTLQNLSTSRRCHSLTEAVYFALLSLFGLECSFHNTFSCIWFFSFSFFGGFRRFLVYKPVYTHDNLIIISQKRKLRQAILRVFSFSFIAFAKNFTFYRKALPPRMLGLGIFTLLIARTNGQYEVLTAAFFRVFKGEGGNRGIERHHYRIRRQRLQRI